MTIDPLPFLPPDSRHAKAPTMSRPLARVDLQINNAIRPFFYRADSGGDRGVIEQIFKDRDYDLSRFSRTEVLHDFYKSMVAANDTALIVDAGANIGASAVYFAGLFPQSKILAIEPETNNCELLRKNCEGLNVSLLEGGIGCDAGNLYLTDPGLGDWGFRLHTEGECRVPVFSAESIIADQVAAGLVPFIFKIDIEGGESELFRDNTSWVRRFPLLTIELHDWLFPGTAVSRNFLRTISSLNFDFFSHGENVFCFNNDLLRPAAT
jgi:FkbM family methyltransferase